MSRNQYAAMSKNKEKIIEIHYSMQSILFIFADKYEKKRIHYHSIIASHRLWEAQSKRNTQREIYRRNKTEDYAGERPRHEFAVLGVCYARNY